MNSVYAFSTSLWNACVPGTVLGSQGTVVNEIDSVLALGIYVLGEEAEKTNQSKTKHKQNKKTDT